MKYIFLLVALDTAGCSRVTYYGGIGHEFDEDHVGHNPVGVIRIDAEVAEDVSCGWQHTSNVFDGTPFNKNKESQSDILHCGFSTKF